MFNVEKRTNNVDVLQEKAFPTQKQLRNRPVAVLVYVDNDRPKRAHTYSTHGSKPTK